MTLTGLLDTYALISQSTFFVINGDGTGTTVPDWAGLSNFCYDSGRRQAKHNTTQVLEALKQQYPELAKVINSSKAAAGQKTGPTVSIALGPIVYSGPVSIFSKKHDTKWASGWVEFMLPIYVQDGTPVELVEQYEQAAGIIFPRVNADQVGKFRFTFDEKKNY